MPLGSVMASQLDSFSAELFFNLPRTFHLAAYASFMISRGHNIP